MSPVYCQPQKHVVVGPTWMRERERYDGTLIAISLEMEDNSRRSSVVHLHPIIYLKKTNVSSIPLPTSHPPVPFPTQQTGNTHTALTHSTPNSIDSLQQHFVITFHCVPNNLHYQHCPRQQIQLFWQLSLSSVGLQQSNCTENDGKDHSGHHMVTDCRCPFGKWSRYQKLTFMGKLYFPLNSLKCYGTFSKEFRPGFLSRQTPTINCFLLIIITTFPLL